MCQLLCFAAFGAGDKNLQLLARCSVRKKDELIAVSRPGHIVLLVSGLPITRCDALALVQRIQLRNVDRGVCRRLIARTSD